MYIYAYAIHGITHASMAMAMPWHTMATST